MFVGGVVSRRRGGCHQNVHRRPERERMRIEGGSGWEKSKNSMILKGFCPVGGPVLQGRVSRPHMEQSSFEKNAI